MPPRHPADGDSLQVHATTDLRGLLDLHRSGDVTHAMHPADDSIAETLLYVGHDSRRDSYLCGPDIFRRNLLEIRVLHYPTLLDGPLVRQGEFFGSLL